MDIKKSHTREKKHLSTDADSSTNTIEGWTKKTPKPNFLKSGKNNPNCKNSKTSRNMQKLRIGQEIQCLPYAGFFEKTCAGRQADEGVRIVHLDPVTRLNSK